MRIQTRIKFEMEEERSWCYSTFGQQASVEKLTSLDLQFPETLGIETIRKHLRNRKIIGWDENVDKEALLILYRKHILPLPQRNESLKSLNADFQTVTLDTNRKANFR